MCKESVTIMKTAENRRFFVGLADGDNLFTLYQNDAHATAQALGVTTAHVDHWRLGHFPIPRHALEVLERLNAGWIPRAEWRTNRYWLEDELKRFHQTPRSLAAALGIAYATAKRYIYMGCGPRAYIMHAIELWLDTAPPPVVYGKAGRPKQVREPTTEDLFRERMANDPEFTARYESVSAMLMRPDASPAEKLKDLALIRTVLGY